MSSLKAHTARLFKFPDGHGPLTIYNEDGAKIGSVDEIVPGAVVFASCCPSDHFVNDSPIEVGRSSIAARSPSRMMPGLELSRNGSRLSRRSSKRSLLIVLTEDAPAPVVRGARRGPAADSLASTEIEEDDIRFANTGISFQAIEKLLAFLPRELWGSAKDVVGNISAITARLASHVEKCLELQDTVMWRCFQRRMDPLPKIAGCVQAAAQAIIDQGTLTNECRAFTKLRHVIVGPAKSGKSTFLHVVTNVLLERFSATGQSRKTLIIYFDMRKIIPCNGSLFELYSKIVTTTFRHIAIQRFDMIPYTKLLIAYFVGLYHASSFVPLPCTFAPPQHIQALAPALNAISERISSSLYADQSLALFLAELVIFPHSIALVFGFDSVHFVVDHLDEADLDVLPQLPLDLDQRNASLMDHLKSMINADSFAVSCASETTLLGLLSRVNPDSLDLRSTTEIISVVDLDFMHGVRYEFCVTYKDTQPLTLRIQDCAGAPGYLSVWDATTQLADKLRNEKNVEKLSRKARELRYVLISQIEGLVGLLYRYDSDGAKRGEIVDVDVLDPTRKWSLG
jgi:hypothetical protein